MKIRQLSSAVGQPDGRQNLTTFVINDRVAIDAGCLGYLSPLEKQRQIEHVLLTHSHIDHVGSLPIFLDNVYQPGNACPTIYANAFVLECLARDFFNDRIWPDLIRVSSEQTAFLKMVTLGAEIVIEVDELRITPVAVDHIVPTFGLIVEDETSAVAFVADSGPTDRIWELANSTPNLRAVFLECSFPNDLQWLAVKTKHLSPQLFREELAKLRVPVQVIAIHLKNGHYAAVLEQLRDLQLPSLQIGGADHEWDFGV
jgi:cAMP phosphodiesterase